MRHGTVCSALYCSALYNQRDFGISEFSPNKFLRGIEFLRCTCNRHTNMKFIDCLSTQITCHTCLLEIICSTWTKPKNYVYTIVSKELWNLPHRGILLQSRADHSLKGCSFRNEHERQRQYRYEHSKLCVINKISKLYEQSIFKKIFSRGGGSGSNYGSVLPVNIFPLGWS